MRLQEAKDAFAVRHYDWSTSVFRRELGAGFPLLGAVQSRSTAKCISFLRSLDVDERTDAALALVKRSHPSALSILGSDISEHEHDLLMRYRTHQVDAPENRRKGFDARRCSNSIKKGFPEAAGAFIAEGSSMGSYSLVSGRWLVQTVVGFGNPPHYSHGIFAGVTAPLLSGASILSSLGISSQTAWDSVMAGDEDNAARSLVLAATIFLDAVPGLLAGLDHEGDDPTLPSLPPPDPPPAPRLVKKT